jgi:hypothetical protein
MARRTRRGGRSEQRPEGTRHTRSPSTPANHGPVVEKYSGGFRFQCDNCWAGSWRERRSDVERLAATHADCTRPRYVPTPPAVRRPATNLAAELGEFPMIGRGLPGRRQRTPSPSTD